MNLHTCEEPVVKSEPDIYINFLNTDDLDGFKEKTDQLHVGLHNKDIDNALRCINELNQINDQNLFKTIGKITRGLHNAISDLQVSATNNNDSSKNKTRAGLEYVIDVTDNAARKTLDMTERSQSALVKITSNIEQQDKLVADLHNAIQGESAPQLLMQYNELARANKATLKEINGNITEIVLAQNFQDLASQSMSKAISLIRGVEASLITLTKHANILRQVGQFSSNPQLLNQADSEELSNSLDNLELNASPEHMDQEDVDSLLSSQGF
jgi:chemotaxis protein CheZ